MSLAVRLALLAALAAAARPGAAHASIITALSGTPVAVTGGYAYTYNVELTGDQQLDPAGASPEFGTVYDFGPILGSVTETGLLSTVFAFTTAATNTPANLTTPTDSPSLTNIRFTYDGSQGYYVNTTTLTSATALPSTTNNLGTFRVVSPYSDLSSNVAYDGQAMKGTNNTITGNVGLTSGPLIPVPEPASLALFGTSVLGLAWLRRRHVWQAANVAAAG